MASISSLMSFESDQYRGAGIVMEREDRNFSEKEMLDSTESGPNGKVLEDEFVVPSLLNVMSFEGSG